MPGRSTDETVMLDACCLLNLSATGQIDRVLRELAMVVGAAERVTHEALFVLPRTAGGESGRPEPVDLPGLVDRGLVTVHSIETDEEASSYVAFAADLDDGEAMTCAIAVHRRFAVATDDRKAIRILRQRAPQVSVVSTPELLRLWAEGAGLGPVELRQMLIDVQ